MHKFLGSFFSLITGLLVAKLTVYYFLPSEKLEVVPMSLFGGVIDLQAEILSVWYAMVWVAAGYYFCYDNHRSKIDEN